LIVRGGRNRGRFGEELLKVGIRSEKDGEKGGRGNGVLQRGKERSQRHKGAGGCGGVGKVNKKKKGGDVNPRQLGFTGTFRKSQKVEERWAPRPGEKGGDRNATGARVWGLEKHVNMIDRGEEKPEELGGKGGKKQKIECKKINGIRLRRKPKKNGRKGWKRKKKDKKTHRSGDGKKGKETYKGLVG